RRRRASCQQPHVLSQLPGASSESKHCQSGHHHAEVLLFPVEQRLALRAYPEFEDLPEDCPVAVYSLNEIATEKVVALSDPARNEPRDLYDLWFLTVEAGVYLSRLVGAIAEKLRFRQKNIAGLEDRILNKEQRLRLLWTG